MTNDSQPLSEYQQFIHAKHERLFNTPNQIIEAIVHKVTGSEIVSQDRIIKGEINEVHSVRTGSGQEIVVRIAHREDPNFEQEKWAIQAVKEAGVPVPEVLLIEKIEHEKKPLTVCVESKLSGVSLSDLVKDGQLSEREQSNLLSQCGKILSKIHSVRVEGFGRIDKKGKGKYKTIQEVLLDSEITESEMATIATGVGLDTSVIRRAFDILKMGAVSYQDIEPRLLHNDFGPKHLLVDGNKISGVLDFEDAEGGDPVREFARWKFFNENSYPIQFLQNGYTDKELFGAGFSQRFNLWKIYLGIHSLNYYAEDKNPSGIRLAKDRLIRDLKYFE